MPAASRFAHDWTGPSFPVVLAGGVGGDVVDDGGGDCGSGQTCTSLQTCTFQSSGRICQMGPW
eukprot:12287284-Prorocentrum_lima.AAC.1